MRRILTGIALSVAATATAQPVEFELVSEYTGSQQPAGWLTATFSDTPDGVELTLSSWLVDREFVSSWLFNLDPMLDPAELKFTKIGSSGSYDDPAIFTASNNFRAGGDGYFDILFAFATMEEGRFGAGDEVVYLITSSEMISAESFNVFSAPAGGQGPLLSAAHIQGVGMFGTGSGWIAAGCYADCDESGSLDLFDFLCFQNAYAAGEPYADCDQSGSLDFMDYLCYMRAFGFGCP
ncbi:MAG: hypothetical protein ACF8R7_00685 [Phycisphaerales bacterium JB039]